MDGKKSRKPILAFTFSQKSCQRLFCWKFKTNVWKCEKIYNVKRGSGEARAGKVKHACHLDAAEPANQSDVREASLQGAILTVFAFTVWIQLTIHATWSVLFLHIVSSSILFAQDSRVEINQKSNQMQTGIFAPNYCLQIYQDNWTTAEKQVKCEGKYIQESLYTGEFTSGGECQK